MNNHIYGWENILKANDVDLKSDHPNITRVGNTIYFYAHIDPRSALEFNKILRQVDCEGLEPIVIRINSLGGYTHSGIGMMENIRMCRGRTISVVEGMCCSSATLMSVVADERHITENSCMLIHQLSSAFWGDLKFEEQKDVMKNMEMLMAVLKSVYKEYTNLKMVELNKIMKRDLYLSANECVQYGLCDVII